MEKFFIQLHHIDKSITLAINSLHCPASDAVWMFFSDKYIWFVMYFIVLLFLIRDLGWKKALIVTAGIGLTITCCDQFSNFTKEFFARLRPCWDGDMVAGGLWMLEDKGNLYGFYSAHAANSIAFSLSSYLGFKWNSRKGGSSYRIYGWAIFIWGALVGLSRIFVGKHFFGDVMVGFAVGMLTALIFSLITRSVCRKLS